MPLRSSLWSSLSLSLVLVVAVICLSLSPVSHGFVQKIPAAGRWKWGRSSNHDFHPQSRSRILVRENWYEQAVDESMIIVPFSEGEDMTTKIRDALDRANLHSVSVDDFLLPTSPASAQIIQEGRLRQIRESGDSIHKDKGNDPMTKKPSERTTLGRQTLQDIAKTHCFSLSFLGDYLVSLGVLEPIDPTQALEEILSDDQSLSLLHALHSLSASQVNESYIDGAASLAEIAEALDIDENFLVRACRDRQWTVTVPLPFGAHSVLHRTLVQKLVDEIKTRRQLDGENVFPRPVVK